MTSLITRFIALLLTFASPLEAKELLPTLDFDRAKAHYEKGEYEKAIAVFESIKKNGWHSAALFQNLGNAYYQADQKWPALLNFYRAQLLGSENASDNLEMTKVQLEIDRSLGPPIIPISWRKPLLIAGCATFWIGLFFMLLPSRKKGYARYLFGGLLSLLGLLIFLTGLWASMSEPNVQTGWVISEEDAMVYHAPDIGTGTKGSALKPGSTIPITGQHGAFYSVNTLGGEGWVQARDLEPVLVWKFRPGN